MEELRTKIKSLRANLTPQQIEQNNQLFLQTFLKQSALQKFQHYAGYLSYRGEAELSAIANWVWNQGKNYYLPILHPAGLPKLWFLPYNSQTILQKNRLGILEPKYESEKLIAAWELEIIFTPLVAFDEKGHRLGQGGGFYDRTFAFLQQQNFRSRPKLIGVAYGFQKVDTLKPNPWDVSLNGIITESNFYPIEKAI